MIRVFPRKTKWTPTDGLAFVGDPPLFRPPEMPVRISTTFTWDIIEAKRLYGAWSQLYNDVQVGGPAFGDPGGQFIPGIFLREGVTITSRGCPKRCRWCFVPGREGDLRELEIKDGWIIQDNNLLACSRPHIEEVFDMLRRQRKAAIFSGGLDSTLFQAWHRDLIDSIRIKELWFACDTPRALYHLARTSKLLTGISRRKKRCYVMVGYRGEEMLSAERRVEEVYALGFDPFCQLYRGENEPLYDLAWKTLARKWSRPAAYHSSMKTPQPNSLQSNNLMSLI